MAGGTGIFFLTMNSVVMGMPEVLPIAGGLGAISCWERGGMIVDIIRIVRLFFGRKFNGKGAMLETMIFWANN